MSTTPSFRVFLGVVVAGAPLLYACGQPAREASGVAVTQAGGRLVATSRSEPKNFDRIVIAGAAEGVFSQLTQATLVRINKITGELEARLAQDWTSSPDGLTWTLTLRPDVTFSDGAPFTAADVLFTFQALYDKRVASGIADVFKVNGQPFQVRALDDHTISLTFPAPYGPGLAILDDLPILPRHKLEAALADGTFAKAWAVTTSPAEIVGLGPFVLAEFVSGQRLRFVRNPRYWRQDDKGQPLPYLDELELRIVPEQDAEVLQLEAGDVDLTTGAARAEDLAAYRRMQTAGTLQLVDAGLSIDPNMLWFNLVPGAAHAKGRAWLQREEFRRAISYAVDRQAIVDTVYLGAAEPVYGPISKGYGEWYVPDLPRTEHDVARAKTLLGSIGLTDRNGDGLIEDAAGQPVRFSILTQKGNTMFERTASVLQEQLRHVGITVDVVALDVGSLVKRWGGADYDAVYFYVYPNAIDPARNLEIWMSSGSFHFWNPEQAKPATDWEAKVDDLMRNQAATLDRAERRRLFGEVQRTMSEHLPLLCFAAPKFTVAMSARVHGATPSVIQPSVLWNADVLSVTAGAKRSPR